MEYYEQELDDQLLQLARQAIDTGQHEDWDMDMIADEFARLIDEESSLTVVNKNKLNAAMEQASYIKDYKPGYVQGRNYPVERE